jgi:hypothetical protein
MKKLFLTLALVALASSAFAQVGAVRLRQQVGQSSGIQVERVVVPTANSLLGFDANKKVISISPVTALANAAPGVLQHATVTVTAAQIKALNTTAVSILAAQGSGKTAILAGPVFIRYTRATASFADGGALVIQYHTGAVAATGTLAAAQITGSGSTDNVLAPIGVAGAVPNDALEITCATGDFTGTTAAGTITVDFNYRVL